MYHRPQREVRTLAYQVLALYDTEPGVFFLTMPKDLEIPYIVPQYGVMCRDRGGISVVPAIALDGDGTLFVTMEEAIVAHREFVMRAEFVLRYAGEPSMTHTWISDCG